jgi:hypothetical protein
MANVAPGEYTLDVRPNPRMLSAGTEASEPEFASVDVTVGADTQTHLQITTGPGAIIFSSSAMNVSTMPMGMMDNGAIG